MAVQKTTSVTYQNGTDKDDLRIQYSQIQGTIAATTISGQFKNTNYLNEPVRGGTVKVKRFKSSIVDTYGTARTNSAGRKLQNNGVDVLIDTDKEIAEEISGKDALLYMEGGRAALLDARRTDYATSMAVVLENAYFLALQTAAVTVDLSSVSSVQDKVLLLIRTLEAVDNENVDKVDRSQMVLLLSPEWFDELKKYTYTLPNPIDGGADVRFFHNVRVEMAVRQTVDATIQVIGAVAQPVVMDEYKVEDIQMSNDKVAYLSFYYGTKVVMPDLVFKGALDESISV